MLNEKLRYADAEEEAQGEALRRMVGKQQSLSQEMVARGRLLVMMGRPIAFASLLGLCISRSEKISLGTTQ